jgi:hypothetical protein
MPSKSKKQHNLMEAVAHNPAFAKKLGIPQSVGQDFSKADKGRKFQKGGIMKKPAFKKPALKPMMSDKMKKFEQSAKDVEAGMKEGSKRDMDADALGYKQGGAVRGQGIAQRGFSNGGKVQTVQVKGVGAARARTAKIC